MELLLQPEASLPKDISDGSGVVTMYYRPENKATFQYTYVRSTEFNIAIAESDISQVQMARQIIRLFFCFDCEWVQFSHDGAKESEDPRFMIVNNYDKLVTIDLSKATSTRSSLTVNDITRSLPAYESQAPLPIYENVKATVATQRTASLSRSSSLFRSSYWR
ncbi:MAG: hypothetical protein BYD32DRAFT_437390 [Podila humilis]|nr:MAG: hypothetical protein BYD32DRAFT_437390 [Podila humilis]